MTELLYKELSYKIVGCFFEVYNQLNYGHREKVYQQALVNEFKLKSITFSRELYFPIKYKDSIVSRYYFDFLVEDKIVVELKVAEDFYQKDINQLLSYLKAKNYRLGLLVLFSKKGLQYKRILN